MAFLIQGSIKPKFDVAKMWELDLSAILEGVKTDLYVVMSGQETQVQAAATVSIDLGGFCKMAPEFEWLCDILSFTAKLEGRINVFLSKDDFGIKLGGYGHFNIHRELMYGWLLDLIGWPEGGMSEHLEITGRLGSKSTTLCVKMRSFDEFCTPEVYKRDFGLPGRVADCPHKYTNVGLTCVRPPDMIIAPSRVANCPGGYTNMGLICYRAHDSYWSWGNCRSGYTSLGFQCVKPPNILGWWEMSCPSGYFISDITQRCHKNCPSDYTNTGEICTFEGDVLGLDRMGCTSNEVKRHDIDHIANVLPRCYPKSGECFDGQTYCESQFKGFSLLCQVSRPI